MFFETIAGENANRLKKVLISDKHFNPENIKRVLKSDIFNVLTNYTDVLPENLNLEIEILENGDYEIICRAVCKRLKIFGALPDNY